MKIVTTWADLPRINWHALFRCAGEYRKLNPHLDNSFYQGYLIEEWGIDHGNDYVRIVDEKKYTLFLLKWA